MCDDIGVRISLAYTMYFSQYMTDSWTVKLSFKKWNNDFVFFMIPIATQFVILDNLCPSCH